MNFSFFRWAFLLVGFCLPQAMLAQTNGYPLKGKTVAVYFSKKQFTFDNNYRIPLSQFIKSDEGKDAEIEDIKIQTLIALGSLFSKQLSAPSQADSIYFLNENPQLGAAFIKEYDSDNHQLNPMGAAFAHIDYILVVNPFVLGSYKTSSVYSRSNRIITDQIIVKTARIRFELFDPSTGARSEVYETCVDDRKTQVDDIFFEFHMEYSITGRFLAKLFSAAVDNMNLGIANACPE